MYWPACQLARHPDTVIKAIFQAAGCDKRLCRGLGIVETDVSCPSTHRTRRDWSRVGAGRVGGRLRGPCRAHPAVGDHEGFGTCQPERLHFLKCGASVDFRPGFEAMAVGMASGCSIQMRCLQPQIGHSIGPQAPISTRSAWVPSKIISHGAWGGG